MSAASPTLPTEVLYLVAQQLVDGLESAEFDFDHDIITETLRNMRLASKEFAIMGNVNSLLFSKIELWDSEEHLQWLDTNTFPTIAPFVSKIVFYPPLYTSNLTLDTFKEILLVQAVHEVDPEFQKFTLTPPEEYWRYVEEKWNGHFPHSEASVKAAYGHYFRRAKVVESRAHVRRLRRTWISILQKFQNVCTVKFSTLDFLHGNLFDPQVLITSHDKNECTSNRSFGLIRRAIASGGEDLLDNAITSLMKADLRIHDFSVNLELVPNPGRILSESISERLGLHQLERFRVAHGADQHHSGDQYSENVQKEAQTVVAAALRRSHTSLRDLGLSIEFDPEPFEWFSVSHLDFPVLRSLRLHELQLPSKVFAADLLHLTELNSLKLDGCLPWYQGSDKDGHWKIIFDAIREHPNLLHIRFNYMLLMVDVDVDFQIATPESSTPWMAWPDERDRELERHLCLYLSKRIEWSAGLEYHFPQS